MLAPLVDLLFPPRCPLCGEGLTSPDGLCVDCWGKLAFPGGPACRSCQHPLPFGVEGLCAPCMLNPPRHDGIAAATLYNDASRRLVLGLKHGGRIALAPLLARMILPPLQRIETIDLGEPWLAVPVPLHRWRLWRRGFNQAALIADALTGENGTLLVDALLRHRATAMLGGLGRAARTRELVRAIRVNPRRAGSLKDAQVVLVDDVLTSGATSAPCVAALKRAGARRVVVACFARVPNEM